MLWAMHSGGLEIRKRASRALLMRGKFPYGKRAVLSDGGRAGRPKKEVIAPGAFAYRINIPTEDIHLLVGHSYDRPLASRLAGTLSIEDTPAAVLIEAEITEEMQAVSYVRDFLAAMQAGLIVGLSPGFRIPPPRTVPDAESVAEEDPREGTALIRTVHQALLYELSAVTVPAYKEAVIEAQGEALADVLSEAQLNALKDAKTADEIKAVLASFTPAQVEALKAAMAETVTPEQVEARNWTPGGLILPERPTDGLHRTLQRWRP
jgi:HK97 family phage prohead protease